MTQLLSPSLNETKPPGPDSTTSTAIDATTSSLLPAKIYNGGYLDASKVRLRIANGGAGQSGLVGVLADAFVRWWVERAPNRDKGCGSEPFLVEWYLGDTTQSLSYLSSGWVDVALTYNEAAEKSVMRSGKAIDRRLIFLDHFYLVGPVSNPAGLVADDTAQDMFSKIVVSGNEDTVVPPDPAVRPPTRFLSRFDKSATNIKESELFITIGQVPWALPSALWYHIYPRFPAQALRAASVLAEYTLTDRGTWLSSDRSVRAGLRVYKGKTRLGLSPLRTDVFSDSSSPAVLAAASASEGDDGLLDNPCSALLGTSPNDAEVAGAFMQWLVAPGPDGGQRVVAEFVNEDGEVLYEPVSSSRGSRKL